MCVWICVSAVSKKAIKTRHIGSSGTRISMILNHQVDVVPSGRAASTLNITISLASVCVCGEREGGRDTQRESVYVCLCGSEDNLWESLLPLCGFQKLNPCH